jgi:uncharacterized protein YycO
MSMEPVRRFLKPIMDWAAEIQLVPYPLWIIAGNTKDKVKAKDIRKVMEFARGGDLIFRRQGRTLGTAIIPGHYSHVGILSSPSTVIHALGQGVVEEDILDFMKTDALGLMRVNNKDWEIAAVDFAKECLGRPYDYIFDSDDKRALYCCELVMYCYPELFPKRMQKRDAVKPDELIGFPHTDMMYESHERKVK